MKTRATQVSSLNDSTLAERRANTSPGLNNLSHVSVYHSALLIEAGLIDGQIIPNATGLPAGTVRLRLTWAGHEFLDAARNDTIWNKAGERIKKSGVDVTISLMKEILSQLLKQSLGLP